jgi:hypothetical protein
MIMIIFFALIIILIVIRWLYNENMYAVKYHRI